MHKRHDVNDMPNMHGNQLEVLLQHIQEFESSIYPNYKMSASDIPVLMVFFLSDVFPWLISTKYLNSLLGKCIGFRTQSRLK